MTCLICRGSKQASMVCLWMSSWVRWDVSNSESLILWHVFNLCDHESNSCKLFINHTSCLTSCSGASCFMPSYPILIIEQVFKGGGGMDLAARYPSDILVNVKSCRHLAPSHSNRKERMYVWVWACLRTFITLNYYISLHLAVFAFHCF